MSQINLTIRDPESLVGFIENAKGAGYLKEVSIYKIKKLLPEVQFPIEIPIDIDAVLKLAGNPVVKKVFGSKVESKTIEILNAALETG